MKHFKPATKKWLMTSALFAVIAANYSLQTSSVALDVAKNMSEGSIELAQTAAPTAASTPPPKLPAADTRPAPPQPEAQVSAAAPAVVAKPVEQNAPAAPTPRPYNKYTDPAYWSMCSAPKVVLANGACVPADDPLVAKFAAVERPTVTPQPISNLVCKDQAGNIDTTKMILQGQCVTPVGLDIVKPATEATAATTAVCSDCVTIALSKLNYDKIAALIPALTGSTTAAPAVVAPVAATPAVAAATTTETELTLEEQLDNLCPAPVAGEKESSSERNDRMKCRRQGKIDIAKDKKEALLQEREEKATDLQQKNFENFEAQLERSQTKCEDKDDKLQCLTTEFSKLTKRYSGKITVAGAKGSDRKINKLSESDVKKAFSETVGSELSSSLFSANSDDHTQALDSLNILLSAKGIPSAYKGLRTEALKLVSKKEQALSTQLNAQFREAARNPKNTALLQDALESRQQFINSAVDYNVATYYSDAFKTDSAFNRYYLANYLPTYKKYLLNINDTANIDTLNADGTTRKARSRSANRNDDDTIIDRTSTRNGASLKGNGQEWTFASDKGGVTTGARRNNSTGTRTAN